VRKCEAELALSTAAAQGSHFLHSFTTLPDLTAGLNCRVQVDHVCNLTDIDDKIIKRMSRDGVTLQQLTNRYADLFFEDLASLNVLPARAYPRATEHVPEIVQMVQQLMAKVRLETVGKPLDKLYFVMCLNKTHLSSSLLRPDEGSTIRHTHKAPVHVFQTARKHMRTASMYVNA
jgi:tRNA synthetases class I (C) catalytic domain